MCDQPERVFVVEATLRRKQEVPSTQLWYSEVRQGEELVVDHIVLGELSAQSTSEVVYSGPIVEIDHESANVLNNDNFWLQ